MTMTIDRADLIEHLLYIDDKAGDVVSYRPNRMQAHFLRNKSNRNIVLKHRQGGLSSIVLADMFTDCITKPHSTCAVVSHETHATQRLLDRVQFYYDTMLPPKPELGAGSRSEKSFPQLHSSIYVGTAGSRAFGRGDTIRKVLLSELAHYEDGETILNGVEDAVPLQGEITIECYDDMTEILTNRGWLRFQDVELTDKVLSKNRETDIAYWSDIMEKIERPATELVRVTGKGIDLAVTPNHNLWARKSGTIQPFGVYQARELFDYSEWEFEAGMEWLGEDIPVFLVAGKPIPAEIWLEYLGFFVSEGWVEKYAVSIYQEGIYQERFKEVAGLVAAYLGKKLGVYANGCQFTIPGKAFADYMSPYTKPKRLPRAVLNLPKNRLSLLLKAYMMGDGEKKRNRCITKDCSLRDDIQEIGLKLGFRTNYTVKSASGKHKEAYNISFYKAKRASVRHSRNQITRVPYRGMVYCLTIPEDHFLMVRRNGKAIWSCNCTPNGEDNVFYDRWIRAKEGKSPYTTFFFPWWWTDEYRIPENSPIALPSDRGDFDYTDEEQAIVDQHHITKDQVRWRRWKIAEKGGLFWQEYPEDEISCFITVGDPVFDTSIINRLSAGCRDPERFETTVDSKPVMWDYWAKPDAKEQYVIGADTAAGSPTGSFSAAVVLDSKWRVVATFLARCQPNEFATVLKEMGKTYNWAEICVERNFTGYAVLGQMTSYPRLYHQRDFTSGKVTHQVGWWTNDQTKHVLYTEMKNVLPYIQIWDANLIRQLRGYRYIRLKPTAQSFDDLAISLMLAIVTKKVTGASGGYQGNVAGYNW